MIPHGGRPGSTLLTERHLEIGRQLQRGASLKAIAQRLELSPRTVEAHIRDAVARIGVPGRPTLILAVWMERFYGAPAGRPRVAPPDARRPSRNRPVQEIDDNCPLTTRQLAVARLIHAGYRYAEIARELHCAVKTAKQHACEASTRIGGRGDPKVILTRYYERVHGEHVSAAPDVRLVS